MIIALDGDEAIIVEGDGALTRTTFDQLNVDWRYDHRHQTWVDVGPLIVEQEEEDGGEEETDDGGEEVSGSLPDTD